MAEKADMPSDTVSLPPTYAPSEAYTETPPPAYRKEKSNVVRVAQMVCLTILAAAFLIGFFTVTSQWINRTSCDCDKAPNHPHHHGLDHINAASFAQVPRVEPLVGLDNDKIDERVSTNDLDAGDDTSLPKVELEAPKNKVMKVEEEVIEDVIPQEIQEVEAAVDEVVHELQEEEEEVEEERLGLQDIMRAQMEEMRRKVKLPIDLILGNPALAGRDVNCEVERRQQPIAPGIVTQAIIVTCHDNDDDEDDEESPLPLVPPQGARRIAPPMSIIAPIMKMLAARARARALPVSGPVPFPPPSSPSSPFPFPLNHAKIMTAGPIIRKEVIVKGPEPIMMKSSGPIISGPFPIRSSAPGFPRPFNVPFPIRGPQPGHIHLPSNNGPLPIQSRRDGPLPPFAIPRPIPLPGPQSLSKSQEDEEEPRHRMRPFPFRPILRKSPKFLPFDLSPPAPERQLPPVPISSLRRGAVKIEELPRPLPEAQGRALSSPVPIRFLPGRLLNSTPFMMTSKLNLPPRPITHMEMHSEPKPEDQIKDFGPPRFHTVIGPAPSSPLSSQHAPPPPPPSPPMSSFQPPLPHPHPKILPLSHASNIPKEIMSPPEPIAQITIRPPIAGTQIPNLPPPPPPRFDPEGHSATVSEINPDAEKIVEGPPSSPRAQGEPRKHHLLILN